MIPPKRHLKHRNHTITRTGPRANDHRVVFPGRTRWGTVAELKADIDAYLAEALPAPQRGGN